MPAKFSSMRSSGTVENLSLSCSRLRMEWNGTSCSAGLQTPLLTSPTKKSNGRIKDHCSFLNRLFIFSLLFGPFGLLSSCSNSDALAIAKSASDRLKLDDPVDQRKQGVILATTNIDAWHHRGATLADENGTSRDGFTAVGLHAETFGVGVASVTG